MEEVTRDCVVSLAAFAAIFGMVYVFLMTRHRERMTMLDRGLTDNPFRKPQQNSLAALKYGMLLVGVGIGYLVAWVLYDYCGMSDTVSITSMICIFGGSSLILNYVIVKSKGLDKE
jgi:uncharacterized membrane protein YfcA